MRSPSATACGKERTQERPEMAGRRVTKGRAKENYLDEFEWSHWTEPMRGVAVEWCLMVQMMVLVV
jgi:hypothetical protein